LWQHRENTDRYGESFMDGALHEDSVRAARLDGETLNNHFMDLHAPLNPHEAAVAADRCYFCYDAPCVTACPTDIDIPLFIRQIQTDQPDSAARTIFDQNILGGMCARVCPTETLCEEACVREAAEGKPVEIGRLQRFATDTLMGRDQHPFVRAEPTGKRVAVVGAGPAGLSAAHRLAMLGNDVVIFEPRPKPGGLNEYGIATYKTVDDFAAREVDWLLQIGGIRIEYGAGLGTGVTLDGLKADFDAVFLSIGLAGVNALGVAGQDLANVEDAVSFISDLRQADDFGQIAVGDHVAVIGGGMTAVDAAVQAKLLGAKEVSIVYRRGRSDMPASGYEQELALSKGVRIISNVRPVAFHGDTNVHELELETTASVDGSLQGTGDTFRLRTDQVFSAIGQALGPVDGLQLSGRKIAVTDAGRTSLDGVWAGGDCASGGDDLTVTAVAEGRDAAMDIHASLNA
jgi:glutamate synthase (NADPH/NADH) small chain